MSYTRIIRIGIIISILYLLGCGDITEKKEFSRKSTYVKPYVTRTGKIVKGSVRKSWSSSPKRIQNRNRSKSYQYRNPNRRKLLNKKK